jgi:hypothetical protein
MPPTTKNLSTIATASLRELRTMPPPRRRRSWFFEFFIAPFTDINEELADRMRASTDTRPMRRTARR